MKQRKTMLVVLALMLTLTVFAITACQLDEGPTVIGIDFDDSQFIDRVAGDEVDLDSLQIRAIYSDETEQALATNQVTITLDGQTFSGGALTEGTHTFKIVYEVGDTTLSAECEFEVITSHVHIGIHHSAVSTTCTTDGTIEYWECSCGKKFSNASCTTEITSIAGQSAFGHDWAKDFIIDVPATCTQKGSKSIHCSRCTATKDVTEIDALDHDFSDWVYNEQSGKHERSCKRQGCDEKQSELCSFGSWAKVDDNNCKRSCSVCGHEEVSAHAWNEGEITVVASHVNFGEKTYTCTKCGATKTEQLPKTEGHGYGDWEITTEPTLEDGGEAQRSCQCGDVQTQSLPALTDTTVWTAGQDSATCEQAGKKTYTSEYGEVTIATSALGHAYGELNSAVAATCSAKGNIAYYQCSRCEKYFNESKQEVDSIETAIDATAHDFGEPTYEWEKTAEGWKCTATRICSRNSEHVESESQTCLFADAAEKTPATYAAKGVHTYSVTFTNGAFEAQSKDVDDIDALPVPVTMVLNNGAPDQTVNVAYGTKSSELPTDITLDGATFDGWYVGGNKLTGEEEVTEPITVYACFKKSVTADMQFAEMISSTTLANAITEMTTWYASKTNMHVDVSNYAHALSDNVVVALSVSGSLDGLTHGSSAVEATFAEGNLTFAKSIFSSTEKGKTSLTAEFVESADDNPKLITVVSIPVYVCDFAVYNADDLDAMQYVAHKIAGGDVDQWHYKFAGHIVIANDVVYNATLDDTNGYNNVNNRWYRCYYQDCNEYGSGGFSGTIEGLGHNIQGLVIAPTTNAGRNGEGTTNYGSGTGLFSILTGKGSIRNLSFTHGVSLAKGFLVGTVSSNDGAYLENICIQLDYLEGAKTQDTSWLHTNGAVTSWEGLGGNRWISTVFVKVDNYTGVAMAIGRCGMTGSIYCVCDGEMYCYQTGDSSSTRVLCKDYSRHYDTYADYVASGKELATGNVTFWNYMEATYGVAE